MNSSFSLEAALKERDAKAKAWEDSWNEKFGKNFEEQDRFFQSHREEYINSVCQEIFLNSIQELKEYYCTPFSNIRGRGKVIFNAYDQIKKLALPFDRTCTDRQIQFLIRQRERALQDSIEQRLTTLFQSFCARKGNEKLKIKMWGGGFSHEIREARSVNCTPWLALAGALAFMILFKGAASWRP